MKALRCRLGWHRWHYSEHVTVSRLWGTVAQIDGMRWCVRRGCDAPQPTRHEVFL